MVDLSYSFESAQRRHSTDRGHRRTPSVELTARLHNARNTSTSTTDSRLSLGRQGSTSTPPESPTQAVSSTKIDLDRVTEHSERLQKRLSESPAAISKLDYFGPEAVDAVPSLEVSSFRNNSWKCRRGSLSTPETLPKSSPCVARRRSEGCVSGAFPKEAGGAFHGEAGGGMGPHGLSRDSTHPVTNREATSLRIPTDTHSSSAPPKRLVLSSGYSRDPVLQGSSKHSILPSASEEPSLRSASRESFSSSSVREAFSTGSFIPEDIPKDMSCKKLSLREFLGERDNLFAVPQLDVGLRYYEPEAEEEEPVARRPLVTRALEKVRGVLVAAISRG